MRPTAGARCLLLGVTAGLLAGCGGGPPRLYGVEATKGCLRDRGFYVKEYPLTPTVFLARAKPGGVLLAFFPSEREAREAAARSRLPSAYRLVVTHNLAALYSSASIRLQLRRLLTPCLARNRRVPRERVTAGLPPLELAAYATPARTLPASASTWPTVAERSAAGLVLLAARTGRLRKVGARIEGSRAQRFRGEAFAVCGPIAIRSAIKAAGQVHGAPPGGIRASARSRLCPRLPANDPDRGADSGNRDDDGRPGRALAGGWGRA